MRKTLKKVRSSVQTVKGRSKSALKAEPFTIRSHKHDAEHFLNKRRSLVPKFARGSRAELAKVKWPTRRQSISLTFAVYVFAGVFMILASSADWGFSKIAQRIFVK